MLKHLVELKLIDYRESSELPVLTWLTPRWDAEKIPVNTEELKRRARIREEKSEAMMFYARQDKNCRQKIMLEYFNEKLPARCGICDKCLDEKKRNEKSRWNSFTEQILNLLKSRPMSLDELESEITPPDHNMFTEVIRELLEEKKIRYDKFWVVHLNH